MSPYSGPNGTWWRIATVLLPLVVAAIIAFAQTKNDVKHLEADLARKADAAVVQANQDAILRELNSIEAKLDRMGVPLNRLR